MSVKFVLEVFQFGAKMEHKFMSRPRKRSQPAKLNLSIEKVVKEMAMKKAFRLGKSAVDYIQDLILRDNGVTEIHPERPVKANPKVATKPLLKKAA